MARDFDGVDDRIVFDNATLGTAQTTLTFAFWGRTDLTLPGTDLRIWSTQSAANKRQYVAQAQSVNRGIAAEITRATARDFRATAADFLGTANGIWTFVAVTYDEALGSNRIKIYRLNANAIEEATYSATENGSGAQSDSTAQWLGARTDGTSFFNGRIAHFGYWNVVLTSAEMYQYAMSRQVPRRNNLRLYVPLWEQAGTTVKDHSGNAFTGTITGAVYINDPPLLAGALVRPIWRRIAAVAAGLVKTVGETVNITEAFNRKGSMLRPMGETVNITESIRRIGFMRRMVNETINITETLAKVTVTTLAKIINETINITEALTRKGFMLRPVAETINISEALNRFGKMLRSIAEIINISETLNRFGKSLRAIAETINITEAKNRVLTGVVTTLKIINETINISEARLRLSIHLVIKPFAKALRSIYAVKNVKAIASIKNVRGIFKVIRTD